MPPNPEVLEALQKRDIEDLRREIAAGFRGVHERQDTTNGKVLKAQADITELEKVNIRRDAQRQYEKIVWYLFTVSTGVIVGLASFIIYQR